MASFLQDEPPPEQPAAPPPPETAENSGSNLPEGGREELSANNDEQTTLTRRQKNKLIRLQRWQDNKLVRRKKAKEKRKEKKRAAAQERERLGIQKDPQVSKFKLMSESTNKFKIVIDMNFEDFMTDSELAKATKQLNRIYSVNRHSENPCQLYMTSVRGRIREQMEITNPGYKNWDVHISDLDYLELLKSTPTSDNSNLSNHIIHEEEYKTKFIYLSGDAEETLPDVDDLIKDESKIFVIGGLVDHNRHKKLCLNRALEQNIKTAKLPLKEHLTFNQRYILSTFTVFEIMIHALVSHKQWQEAFNLSVPKRKIAISSGVINKEGNNDKDKQSKSD